MYRNFKKRYMPSKTSPTDSRRGCLGPNGKYHSKWCDGSNQAQGIGALEGQGSSTLTKITKED